MLKGVVYLDSRSSCSSESDSMSDSSEFSTSKSHSMAMSLRMRDLSILRFVRALGSGYPEFTAYRGSGKLDSKKHSGEYDTSVKKEIRKLN